MDVLERQESGDGAYVGRCPVIGVVDVALQEQCDVWQRVVVADNVGEVRVCFAANIGQTSRVSEVGISWWWVAFVIDGTVLVIC